MKNVMKKLLIMCVVLLLAGVTKGNYLYPSDYELGVSTNLQLEWEGESQLYFWCLDESYSDVANAKAFAYDTEEGGWSPRTWARINNLEYGTMYYWRVDMRKWHGYWDRGEIWHFTTETVPEVPEPATICLLGLGIMMVKAFRISKSL